MNTSTAYRSFGDPGYSPAKKARIQNHRWYLVTMQNTEHDQGDGYYLADGEYTDLLPGAEARRRRTSRLNHCNRIVEYAGPVFRCVGSRGLLKYVTSLAEVENVKARYEAERLRWCAACEANALRHESMTIESLKAHAVKTGIGIARLDDDDFLAAELALRREWAEESRKAVREQGQPENWVISVELLRA